jgi:hypothetical protein
MLALLVPLALLGLMLAMERIEQPLRELAVTDTLDEWLDHVEAEELERYISQRLSAPLDRYWRRRALRRRTSLQRLSRAR